MKIGLAQRYWCAQTPPLATILLYSLALSFMGFAKTKRLKQSRNSIKQREIAARAKPGDRHNPAVQLA